MDKDPDGQITAQMTTMNAKIDAMSSELTKLTRWMNALHMSFHIVPGAFCVILHPGHCHTFPSAPTGKLTIENETDQDGSIEMSWGSFTSAGDVQQTSTREAQPTEWPATICNTGTVQLIVCPV